MPSLQTKHKPSCPITATTFEFDRKGCTCKQAPDKRGPRYYVSVREGGTHHREFVGYDRKDAKAALNARSVEVDTGAWQAPQDITFTAWAEEWLGSLEVKPSTVENYGDTIKHASNVFGNKIVRKLTVADVTALSRHLKDEAKLSDSTRAKHLRVLHACLAAAIPAGYAARNPVKDLPRNQKPRPKKRESAFFENGELQRLLAEAPEGVYRTLFRAAADTGLREGELAALMWGDVDIVDGVIRVRRTVKDGRELSETPKTSRSRRSVKIINGVVDVLGRWKNELGDPANNTLVFPGATTTGYLTPHMILRQLYAAMERAGVPRVGPTGEERTFHSFRHTYAKRVLEKGGAITWLRDQLGHESITTTVNLYGHFEESESRRQARALEEAGFDI